MRKYGWEDFALPLVLVFALTFALTLHRQIELPTAVTPAVAATATEPGYVMTITARRLPAECKGAGARAASCASYLTGEARVEICERDTHLAQRSQGGYGY